jgi:hypothetical protein
MWSILFWIAVGIVIGARFHPKILPYVSAGEAYIGTWIKGLKEGSSSHT